MTSPRPRDALGLASLCLCLWILATGSAAEVAKPAPPSTSSTAGQAGSADPGLAYRYNTSNWAFVSSSAAYRALANADPALVGAAKSISARIFMAYNLANLGRTAEARSALDQAESQLTAAEPTLAPIDRRMLGVNLLIGRSVIEGNIGSRAGGAARSAAFELSAGYGVQAAQLATAPLELGASSPTASTGTGEALVLDPASALALNLDRDRTEVANAVARPMSADEKLAELEARAAYAEAAARLALNQPDRASAANAHAGRALGRLAPHLAAWLRALVDDQTAELELRAGDAPAAAQTLTRAVATMQSSHGLSRPEAYLWRRLARVQVRLGQTAAAKASEEKSFDILVAETDSAPPTRDEVASYQALLAPSALAANPDDVAKFFTVSSLAIETQTAGTIADVALRLATGDSATAVAIRRLQVARRKLDVATARVSRVHEAAPPASPEQIKIAEDDLDAAQREVAEAAVSARSIGGARADAVISPKTDLAQVQAVLAPDEAYLRFVFLDDGKGYAILVRKSAARVVALTIDEVSAAKMVANLRGSTQLINAVDDSGQTTAILPAFKLSQAAQLYGALFGALDPGLTGVGRLVIEPAGSLFALPFGALLVRSPDRPTLDRWTASRGRDYRDMPWLARDKTIELSVGAAGFVRLRGVKPSTAPRPLIAFADPTPSADPSRDAQAIGSERETRGLVLVSNPGPAKSNPDGVCAAEARGILAFPALPETKAEAAAAVGAFGEDPARAVVAGSEFTDEAVESRRDLSDFRILLFATHAALPNQAECWPNPFLITTRAQDATSEGVLETGDISGLELNADMVVLSACNTAAGDTGGQALGGLAQSFIFAGSRSVVVSHWSVDSRATAELITGFFTAISQKARAGDALAQAERRLMADEALSHPYYWAAFTIVGGPTPD